MVRTLPTVARLQAVDRDATTFTDGTAECHLRLERTPLFDGAMTITLVDDSAGRGFTADPVTIAAGQNDGVLLVRRKLNEQPSKHRTIRVRGRGELSDGTVVVAEATIQLKSSAR